MGHPVHVYDRTCSPSSELMLNVECLEHHYNVILAKCGRLCYYHVRYDMSDSRICMNFSCNYNWLLDNTFTTFGTHRLC